WFLKRWALVYNQSLEYLVYLSKPGQSLESMDALGPAPQTSGVIQALSAAAGAAGRVRLQISGLTSPDGKINLNNENSVVVWGITSGAGKCTEANSSTNDAQNNSWKFNIIDATHIDLVGSTFVGGHTGTSGTGPGGFGAIGTSLEALTFSFDSI